MVEVKIIADSIDHRGNRITTYLTRFTQTIVKEVLRHRMLSFSSSSMRAIPAHKVAAELEDDFFSPVHWQKAHSGMQGKEYFDQETFVDEDGYEQSYSNALDYEWELAKEACEESAERISDLGGTKQMSNRLLEPFGYVNLLITATEYDNFFELRCPQYTLSNGEVCHSKKDAIAFSCGKEDTAFYEIVSKFVTELEWMKINTSMAEIHVQELAEAMWDARNWASPKELAPGEWHIPFSDRMDDILIAKMASALNYKIPFGIKSKITFIKLMISAARCARLSYNTFEGEIDHKKDLKLAFMLATDKHWSPFEHSGQSMTDDEYSAFVRAFIDRTTGNIFLQEGWLANFRGFKQFRQMI